MFWNKKNILILLGLALALTAKVANADYTFGSPLNLGPTVNSSLEESGPIISADGLSLYFTSNNRSGGYGKRDMWVTTRATVSDPWDPPVNLGPAVNSSSEDGAGSISVDGLELYFTSDSPGGQGASDIWVATRETVSSPWEEFFNPGSPVNSSYVDFAPAISPDGLELYFCSQRPGGSYPGDEIWVTRRETKDAPWSEPVNLGPTVNSSYLDSTGCLSPDGLALFFQSNRPDGYGGPLDIWVTTRPAKDADWGTPVNLGPVINTSGFDGNPSISADGSTLYFASNRNGGYGSNDLWQASIDPVVDLNGDGKVDCADMCIMVDYWDTNEPVCDIGPMPWGDGIVDVNDLIVLAEHLFPGLPDNVIERRISAGSDDAEEALTAGYYNWNESSDLELVYDLLDNGGSQLVGMTFRDIDIEPGEVIDSAYIELVCNEIFYGTDDAYFLIWGHLTENSEGFVEPFVISDRPQTDAKVPWQPDPWDAGGQTIRTANIAPIIQELIDQGGWVAGNAVEIIIGADPDKPAFSGIRVAESYDGSPSSAPLLHIEIADLTAQ